MKKFEPGQKVVFTTAHLRGGYALESFGNYPMEMEVITLYRAHRPGWWVISEYQFTKTGKEQAISEIVLFLLQQITRQETDKLILDLEASRREDKKKAVLFLMALFIAVCNEFSKKHEKSHS